MIDLCSHVTCDMLGDREANLILVDDEIRAALDSGDIAQGKIVKICGKAREICVVCLPHPVMNFDGTVGAILPLLCKKVSDPDKPAIH